MRFPTNIDHQNFPKILVLVKILEISKLVKVTENLDFGQNFKKIRLWSKSFKNFDFGQNFSKNLDFGQNYRKISILVKIFENLDFGQRFRKSPYESILSEKLPFCQIFEDLPFGDRYQKSLFW